MRRTVGRAALVAALLALGSGWTVDASPAPDVPADVVAGELLVSVRAPVDLRAIADLVDAHGLEPLTYRPDVAVVRVGEGRERMALDRLAFDPRVRWASRHHIARAAGRPNDPLYTYQWHLAARAAAPGGANWEPVHGSGPTGRGITVAVLDTGVTANEDLDGVLTGIDLVDDDTTATDAKGHGTHVAGTIAQSTGNGIGASGVASAVAILPIRALDAAGLGLHGDIINGIAYAAERGARVLNLSIAGSGDGGLCDAVGRAVAAGVTVVASTGNDAGPVAFPAACPTAIAVSATAFDGALAPYSNRGSEVTLAAPGGDNGADLNLDARPDGILQYTFREGVGGYSWWTGTSMAAPHVSGAVALMLEVNPALTPALVRDVLTATAFDLGAPGRDQSFGAGVVDVSRAVAAAADRVPSPVPDAPDPAAPPPPPVPGTPDDGRGGGGGSTPTPRTAPTAGARTTRVAGSDRYGTAVAASRAAFNGGAERVFLASGRAFADALAAGAAAGNLNGPILLTEPCSLPPVVAQELERLGPREVWVVGGEAAVCSAVLTQAAAAARATPRRVAGLDRFDTAAALSRAAVSDADVVFLANGLVFADSLPGGSAAAASKAPLLLTLPCELPEPARAELARLKPAEVVVVGGTRAVCDAVVADAKAAAGAKSARRIAGTDRYSTSALLSTITGDAPVVVLASGITFADGLAAGGLTAPDGAPLLLVPTCEVPESVRDAVERLGPDRLLAVGGRSAVCDDVLDRLGAAAAGR